MSALLTWDSKVTTVNALAGGVSDLVRQKLKQEGLYNKFICIASREYGMVFKHLNGENTDYCVPKTSMTIAGLEDFTTCS